MTPNAAPSHGDLAIDREAEAFLIRERDVIRGDVLEFGGSSLTRRLHVGATSVTVVGTPAQAPVPVPGELNRIQSYGFDCVLLVAPRLEEGEAIELVRWIRAALRPGGALLAVLGCGDEDGAVTVASRLFADPGECRVSRFHTAGLITLRAVTGEEASHPPGAPVHFEGRLERVSCDRASGWAWSPDAPLRRLRVELWEDERYLMGAWAMGHRPDLEGAGKGDGCCGFVAEFEEPLHTLPVPQVTVAPAGAARLSPPPLLASCACPGRVPTTPLAGAEIETPRPDEPLTFPWLEIRGWAVGSGGPVQRVELSHSGRLFRSVPVHERRFDLAERFEAQPWALRAGFSAQINLLGLGGPLLLDVDAVLWNEERVRVGRIAGTPGTAPPVPVSVLLAEHPSDAALPALTQNAPVRQVASLRAGINPGHPGFANAGTWNAPFGDPSGVVWLTDGTEQVSERLVSDATRALCDHPRASFAVASAEPTSDPPTLARVLSGSALGVTVLVRTSAIHGVGGIDESATSAAFAQWDLAIRLVEAGHTGIELQAARPGASLLRQRVTDDELSVLYRKHATLYEVHLRAILRDLTLDVDRQRHAAWAQERSVTEHARRLRARRLERDRLARLTRQHGAGRASREDLWRLEPPVAGGPGGPGPGVDRFYIEQFLDKHAEDIHGLVLEYGSSGDAGIFAGGCIDRLDTLPVLGSQPPAPDRYDCVISIDALRCAKRPAAAIAECRRALKPGGVLLVAALAASPMASSGDLWRLSRDSLEALLAQVFPADSIEVSARGPAPVVITGRAVSPR